MTSALHLSIVSHRQRTLANALLVDLAALPSAAEMRVTVLSNVPEPAPDVPAALAGRFEHVTNEVPAGYGTNHNRVFRRCNAPHFAVLNPDVRFPSDPFPALLEALARDRIALSAPAAYDSEGRIQDSARKLPTLWGVASKLWRPAAGPDYPPDQGLSYPDCVAGFFMLFRSSVFRELGGFDGRYFLYYEDFDLCCRLRLANWKIAWLPQVRVIHDARRRSHRDPRYLLHHARSIARFFASPVYRAARQAAHG